MGGLHLTPREQRKSDLLAAVLAAGEGVTTREAAVAVGLKPTRYVRDMLTELVNEGRLAVAEYPLPSGWYVLLYMDPALVTA